MTIAFLIWHLPFILNLIYGPAHKKIPEPKYVDPGMSLFIR